MKKFNIEEKEMFSLLTSRQVGEISDAAVLKNFEPGQIIYDHKEQVNNLYILLEGEVSLRLPSRKDISAENFSLEIEKISGHGIVFGPNLLFGVKRYMTRARVTKTAKILVIDAKKFLNIIRENKSEFAIMSYLAKVYFKRYINAMKEIEDYIEKTR
jgi:CRP-like cAMP-binding protein